jgi:DNA-directed RNA polymerase specialized sigma24 family protein
MTAKDHSSSRPGEDPSAAPPSAEGEEPLSARQAAERLAAERVPGRALDAVQDVLLTLLRRTEALGKKSLEQWRRFLNGALWNMGKAASRHDFRERQALEGRRTASEADSAFPSTEAELLRTERTAMVESLLVALSPRERRIFLLIEWRRWSLRAAATALYGGDGPDALRQAHSALVTARRQVARAIQGWSAEDRAAIFEGVDAIRLGALLERLAADLGLQDEPPEVDGEKKS